MKVNVISLMALIALVACNDLPGDHGIKDEPLDRDLDSIAADTLRIGVIEDAITWEERTYGDAGLEWDLLTAFAEARHLRIVPVPMDSLSQLRRGLLQGEVDVIAAQLGEGLVDSGGVVRTHPYTRVFPVLVVCRPFEGKNKNVVDTVQVSLASVFGRDPLVTTGTPGKLNPVYSYAAPTTLLDHVVLGKQDAVMVNNLAAARAMEQFPHLSCKAWSEEERPLVFAVRANAIRLLEALNAHLDNDQVQRTLAGELRDLRYKERTAPYGSRTPAVMGDTISGFDKLFKRVADSLRLDWHLLAAIAFRESRFDSLAGSHMGAQGLMQLMPATAAHFSGKRNSGVEGHVIGAAVYLLELDTLWQRSVPDKQQRQRFVLASYNAGEAHIQDAQRLAEHMGLRKDRWENHVERALLLLACPRYWRSPPVRNGFCKGSETFRYVRNVIGTWAYFGTVKEEDVLPETPRAALGADSVIPPTGTQVANDSAAGSPHGAD